MKRLISDKTLCFLVQESDRNTNVVKLVLKQHAKLYIVYIESNPNLNNRKKEQQIILLIIYGCSSCKFVSIQCSN